MSCSGISVRQPQAVAASCQDCALTAAAPVAAAGQSEDQAAGGKLKMLCLHGFLQNGNILRMRIGSMRKGLKSRVHFQFHDAPFHAASTLTEQQVAAMGGGADGLTWFLWSDLGADKRPSLALKYSNWDATYASLCDALRQQQPDGLFGFSQGATAAALFLAALQTAQRQGKDLDVRLPKFCVVCAGFLPRDPEYAALLEAAKVDVPTLFVMGTSDALIPPARSHALMDTFDQRTADMFEHPGAHMVPTCTGEFKQQMVAFLDRFGSSAPGSVSVGSSLDSLGNTTAAAGAEQQQGEVAAAVGKCK
ncbi:serine hydrolase-domain-containing protein [Scenedesmus sp. NREL 46B-D3]|nr:serine hydrolase-domain-containing protein [Scenedesmus sp. NREL 46B-D3]